MADSQLTACPAIRGSSEQEGHLDPRHQVTAQSPPLHSPGIILSSTTSNFFRFQCSVFLLFFLVCLCGFVFVWFGFGGLVIMYFVLGTRSHFGTGLAGLELAKIHLPLPAK